MNSFLFEERIAEEYRRDKMAAAEEHNRFAHLYTNKATIFAYRSLAYVGKVLEISGHKFHKRYEALALQKKATPFLNR